MGFEKQPPELNNTEKQQKREDIITGKELKGKIMAGIGTVDLDIYKKYFMDKEIECKIYIYKNNPELALLVLDTPALQRQIFDELVNGNEDIKGAFWSDSIVKEETELELVHE